MSVAIADYDNDGLPDIFVTNDKLFNFLYHNKGHNQFEEVGFELGVALPEHGNLISAMGCDFRDLNNDGYRISRWRRFKTKPSPFIKTSRGLRLKRSRRAAA